MRKSNFALRLQPSLLDEARKLAEEEGVALNQLVPASRVLCMYCTPEPPPRSPFACSPTSTPRGTCPAARWNFGAAAEISEQ
jgi:hypothetical protein